MATLLDGKGLAERLIDGLREEYARLRRPLSLALVMTGASAPVAAFVARKEAVGRLLGVDVRRYQYDGAVSTGDLRTRIASIVHDARPDGVIVQLPLPDGVSTQSVLNSVPPELDVDGLSARSVGNLLTGRARALPPVVGAIRALFDAYQIEYREKTFALIGAGLLVGKPVAAWLLNERATFTVIRSSTRDAAQLTRSADILVSGAGRPNLITADMVKEGAVVIDAGTSESDGRLAGDVDFGSVSLRASFITPVPGGIGPLTVAMIYRNLLELHRAKSA